MARRRDRRHGVRLRLSGHRPGTRAGGQRARRAVRPECRDADRDRLHRAQRARRPARRAARAEAEDGAVSALAVRLRFARTGSGKAGLAGSLLLLALIALGPFFAPHDPAGIAGLPLQRPSGQFLIGTDGLGRDVLSRVLWGGRSIVGLAVRATALGYDVGAAIGLLDGSTHSLLDPLLMRAMDVLLAV